MEQEEKENSEVKREVGVYTLIAIGVGGTLGASIFAILGYAAGMAGPSVVLSFLIGGLLTVLVGLTYSELSSTFPESGGGYTFAKKAYGGLPAFLTGWLMAFSNIVFGALSALGFAQIIGFVAGIPYIMQIPIALALLLLFTVLNFRGIEESGRTQIILVVVLIIGFAIFTGISAFFVSEANLQPFMPAGWPGIIEATSFTFVSYFGFETIATVSGEASEPGKDIAVATMASVLICTVIFVSIAWVAIGVVGGDALAAAVSPLMLVGEEAFGLGGIALVGVVGAIATLSSLNTSLLASSRIVFALARDGFMPDRVSKTNENGVPVAALILASALMAVFVSTGVVEYVAHVADFNLFVALILVTISLLFLRRKRAVLERPFKSPRITAPLSAIALGFFLLFLNNVAIATGVAIVFVGIIIYLMKITPRANRALTLGGISGAAGYALLFVMWIGDWSLIWNTGTIGLELAPFLTVGSVALLFTSLLCAVPLGRLFVGDESIDPASPTLHRVKIFEDIIAAITIIFGVFALGAFYIVFHGGVTFPAMGEMAVGYRLLLILSLVGYAFSAIIAGIVLWQRKYATMEE